MSRVGLVVVSHSPKLADGVVEVAAQMAPDVTVVAAGGTADGGIGTDFDAVDAAVDRAEHGAGVVVLYDLGSARMVAELVLESLADPDSTLLVDAPLVEGTVAAAVAAQGGSALGEVADAARSAAEQPRNAPEPASEPEESVTVRLANEIGLHARPAALLARTLSQMDAQVAVRLGDASADGNSVLALMALGARKDDELVVSATGPQAAQALRAVEDLVARNFDEAT
jgi:PTS hybrid protein